MKKFILLAVLAASIMTTGGTAEAGSSRSGTYVSQRSNDNIFSRLMELERRKNAALRRMFFGR